MRTFHLYRIGQRVYWAGPSRRDYGVVVDLRGNMVMVGESTWQP